MEIGHSIDMIMISHLYRVVLYCRACDTRIGVASAFEGMGCWSGSSLAGMDMETGVQRTAARAGAAQHHTEKGSMRMRQNRF